MTQTIRSVSTFSARIAFEGSSPMLTARSTSSRSSASTVSAGGRCTVL